MISSSFVNFINFRLIRLYFNDVYLQCILTADAIGLWCSQWLEKSVRLGQKATRMFISVLVDHKSPEQVSEELNRSHGHCDPQNN